MWYSVYEYMFCSLNLLKTSDYALIASNMNEINRQKYIWINLMHFYRCIKYEL